MIQFTFDHYINNDFINLSMKISTKQDRLTVPRAGHFLNWLLPILFLMNAFAINSQAQTCGNPVNAPVTLNGISVTGAGTGSVSTYPNPITSCVNANTPANSVYIGQSGAFTYTYTFSQPINDLVIVINATGNTLDEFFTITTNGPGTPNVTSGNMCYTVITGNFIASGLGSPGGANGGGGGIFTVNNPGGNYTSVTISGPGGQNGSLMALCSLSIVAPCPLGWNTVNFSDVTCNGGTNGSITVDVINGVAPVNYNLQPGNITNQSGN
ncbi:MAG: SprB repeat-containing protein, partial [Chitinophagaceae bacterium]|nr:SprB repeat-containing protein [Chitinophagaceae bacterium]